MRTIIVDDDPDSHKVLKKMLCGPDLGIEIVASGFSVAEGLGLVSQYHPDLLFLDIEMGDGLGFDLLRQIEKPDFFVIFVTAFERSNYLLSALQFGALDYLVKPVELQKLEDAVKSAKFKSREKIYSEQLRIALETFHGKEENKLPARIGISTLDKIIFRNTEDIIRLEADTVYTHFIFNSSPPKLTASKNLGYYESQFGPWNCFMRVHKSHMVNLTKVKDYVKTDGGYLKMSDGSTVSVGKTFRTELMKRLESKAII